MEIGNLPINRQSRRKPMVWGSPPPRGSKVAPGDSIIAPPHDVNDNLPAMGVSQGAISQVSFSINYNSGAISTGFPKATRVGSQGFVIPVAIVSVIMSSSLVNATTDGVVGAFVARDLGTTIDVTTATDLYVEHYCNAGLGHSMRSGVSFADQIAPKFGSNEQFAIYIMSGGTGFASNLAVVTATIRFFPL